MYLFAFCGICCVSMYKKTPRQEIIAKALWELSIRGSCVGLFYTANV